MASKRTKIRLYVDAALASAQPVPLNKKSAHYLFNVMRLGTGDAITVFNGRDGAWSACVTDSSRNGATLACLEQTRQQTLPPDIWLLFAPIKKARTDFIVEKAAEMGVRAIQPVLTEFTNAERVRTDRLQAHAIEAAEQCGGTFVPTVRPPMRLPEMLANWPRDRRLMFCDETRGAENEKNDLAGAKGAPWAVLIGPEGGFSPEEKTALIRAPFVTPVSLGPRILRADTAAVAALTYWQMSLGDWT